MSRDQVRMKTSEDPTRGTYSIVNSPTTVLLQRFHGFTFKFLVAFGGRRSIKVLLQLLQRFPPLSIAWAQRFFETAIVGWSMLSWICPSEYDELRKGHWTGKLSVPLCSFSSSSCLPQNKTNVGIASVMRKRLMFDNSVAIDKMNDKVFRL